MDPVAAIAKCISPQNMRAIAVIYFGFEKTDVQEYIDHEKDNQTYIDDWIKRDKKNTNEELARILYHAANHPLASVRKIEEHLKISKEGLKDFVHEKAGVDSRLTESELGRLAMEITKAKVRQLATLLMGYNHTKLEQIEEDHRRDGFFTRFRVFVDWFDKNGGKDERKKLAKKLYQGAEEHSLIDIKDIEPILNVTKEQAFGEDSGGAAGAAMDVREEGEGMEVIDSGSGDAIDSGGHPAENRTSKNIQDAIQQPAPKPILDGPEPGRSVAVAASVTSQSAQDEIVSWRTSSERQKAQTMGLPGKQLDKYQDTYEWWKMKEIRLETGPMTQKVKPVVVAVLDSGIYEDFDIPKENFKLKDYIRTQDSQNFVRGKDADLREDSQGHGTFVAGIIALNGPVNVKIINLKALEGPWESVIKALEKVKTMSDVDIINISGGALTCDKLRDLDEIIRDITGKKIIIASAGNDGARHPDSVFHPAKDPNVISVGSVESYGHQAGHSSEGQEVNILCPGEKVISYNSAYKSRKTFSKQKPYLLCDGTSFAAPYACAVAAHVLVAYEAKLLAERNSDGTQKYTSDQARAERNKLVNTKVMRRILQSMRMPSMLLSPWEKSFKNTEVLMHQCKEGLEDRIA